MPHRGQQTVRLEARRFNWLAAGRRWRKTTNSMAIAVEEALAGKRVLWGAPTYDQVRVGWDEMRHAAGEVVDCNISQMVAKFPGGGRILYRSLDRPNNARGHTADVVFIDEAADVMEEAWYEVLRPMLLDTGGVGWFTGTPKQRNWFWREHQSADQRADSIAWQAPTLGAEIRDGLLIRVPHPLENPAISFTELESLHATLPERTFRQEILAEFLEDVGGVFRRVRAAATATPQDKRAVLTVDRKTRVPIAWHRYVIGCDFAKLSDFTVLAVVDVTTRELVALDRFNQIDYALQRKRLQALCDRFRPQIVIAERNAMGEPIIEELQRAGLPVQPFTTTNSSKAEAIDALSLAFEKADIRILDSRVLIEELESYQATRTPGGLLRYSAPDGQHDDCVMALALAWQGVTHGRVIEIDSPYA